MSNDITDYLFQSLSTHFIQLFVILNHVFLIELFQLNEESKVLYISLVDLEIRLSSIFQF